MLDATIQLQEAGRESLLAIQVGSLSPIFCFFPFCFVLFLLNSCFRRWMPQSTRVIREVRVFHSRPRRGLSWWEWLFKASQETQMALGT